MVAILSTWATLLNRVPIQPLPLIQIGQSFVPLRLDKLDNRKSNLQLPKKLFPNNLLPFESRKRILLKLTAQVVFLNKVDPALLNILGIFVLLVGRVLVKIRSFGVRTLLS